MQAIVLTLQLATLTTLVLLVIATPVAWWLSNTHSRWRAPVGALVTLPLVLPPSVLGFYLLVAMGPDGPLGRLTTALGWGTLSFTFTGLLIGSIIFSLPFTPAAVPWNDEFTWESFNYAPLTVLVVILFATVLWFASGKKQFHTPVGDLAAAEREIETEIGPPPPFPEAP